MDGTIVSQFKAGRYGDGFTEGVAAILNTFAGVRVGLNWPLVAFLIDFTIVSAIAISLAWSGRRSWAWECGGLLLGQILGLFRTMWTGVEKAGDRAADGDDGSVHGAGFSSAFSDGVFVGGGFGGGFSDGAGATGSW